MGKVKDVESASKPAKPVKGKPGGSQPNTFVMFFLNLGQTGLFKPMQGWYARIYTALGLGVIAAAGVWHVYESSIDYNPYWRLGIPAALALGFGWLIFRIVHFPPFAEFLDRHRGRDEQGLMDEQGGSLPSDHGRACHGCADGGFLVRGGLALALYSRNIGVLQFTGGGGFGSTA